MNKTIRTADDLQKQLDKAILGVQKKKGGITPAQANAVANVTGKKLNIFKQQMIYATMTRSIPYIPFLQTAKPRKSRLT